MDDLTPYQNYIQHASLNGDYKLILSEDKIIEKKLCVILHLYYQDLWDWFLPYIQNINFDFDLYISICNEHSADEITEKIKQNFPEAKIVSFDNKGMDVAPFLWFMNYIVENNKQYQSVLKLHSKKSLAHGFELGERWRKDLTNALLFNNYFFENYIEDCINTDYKMFASSNWILPQKLIGYEQNYFSQPINFDEYEFVGGTMFLANFNLIKDWFVEEDIYNKFYNEFQEGYIGDGSIAHQIERILGCLLKLKGFEIYKA